MGANWPEFSPHKLSSSPMENMEANGNNHNPSWVDEFLDFSSSKRGTHQRSMSDSVAFLDIPMVEECRRSSIPGSNGGDGGVFEKFDDEQLMSMFTDDIVASGGPNMSCSNPSSPSDHDNMNDDEKESHDEMKVHHMKSEPEEVQSSCNSDGQMLASLNGNMDNYNDKIVDPKRIKRILANRQSAQRSRVRKLQYISELERTVTSLQAEISVLSPRVAFLDHQRLVLGVDNSVLKQKIAALAQDKIFKDVVRNG